MFLITMHSSIFIYAYQIQQVFFCQSFGRMNNTEKENIKVPTAKNIYRESQNIKIKSTFFSLFKSADYYATKSNDDFIFWKTSLPHMYNQKKMPSMNFAIIYMLGSIFFLKIG